MKKSIALLLAVLMLPAMAACQPAASVPEASNSEAAAPADTAAVETSAEKEPVTLKFFHWQSEISEQIDDVINAFEKEYPWITVEQEIVPTADWPTVAAARVAGNDPLDIVGVQPWNDAAAHTPSFYENNFLMSLEDLECVKNFDAATLSDDVRTDGVLTSLPLSAQTMLVFYNKDLFKQYSISVPTTWSEFMAACETLKANGIAPIAVGGKDGWPISNMGTELFSTIVLPGNDGYQLIDEICTGEKTWADIGYDKIMQCYADITDNGYWYGDPLATAYADAPVIFGTGKCAMYEDGSWSATQILDCEPDFEVGVFRLNGSDDASIQNMAVKYGMTVGIASRTEHPEESKLFVEYLFRSDVYQSFVDACKYLPTETGVTCTASLTTAIKELIDSSNVVSFNATYSASKEAAGLYYGTTGSIQGLVAGEFTIEQALADMQKKTDDSLALMN